MMQAINEDEIKQLSIKEIRESYVKLANTYNKVVDREVLLCPKCGEFYSVDSYYVDNKYATKRFPICKTCVMEMVQGISKRERNKKIKKSKESKETVKDVLRLMDLPYIDSLYDSCIIQVKEDMNSAHLESPFSAYISQIKALNQWKGKTWKDSEFGDTADVELAPELNRKPRKDIIKIFGYGFTNEDYLYLQDQYDDWNSRVQISSKSQETYIVRICFKLLDIWKAQRQGKDTSKLDDSLNTLMGAANLQPKQNVDNSSTDNLTFGQLIEKWENEKPVSEPSEEFKDVDGIGKYLRVWFSGWLVKALGLKNGYTSECEEEIEKYTVHKLETVDDETSQTIYNEIFGIEGVD